MEQNDGGGRTGENYRKQELWESRRNGAKLTNADRLETGAQKGERCTWTQGRNGAGASAFSETGSKAVSWQTRTMSPPQGPSSPTEPLPCGRNSTSLSISFLLHESEDPTAQALKAVHSLLQPVLVCWPCSRLKEHSNKKTARPLLQQSS